VSGLTAWFADVVALDPDDRRTWVHEPDGATSLVFRTTAGGDRDLQVVGPRTRGTYVASKKMATCVKMRIRPGGAEALLGVPASDLVDRVVPLTELWGDAAVRLGRDLSDADMDLGVESMRMRVESVVLEHLSGKASADLSPARLLRDAAEALAPRPGGRPEPIGSLARRLAVSERHLRDLFTKGVGVSPKRFARIERVRSVLANAPDTRWARLATETGYYDQSHMTAEFRTLMGVPPGAFFAGRIPDGLPCQGR
jgi:AraC-like DNA-binding protein